MNTKASAFPILWEVKANEPKRIIAEYWTGMVDGRVVFKVQIIDSLHGHGYVVLVFKREDDAIRARDLANLSL